ncbi:MAG TPA: thioredoxin family protein [Neobacillus sp.]|jgi:hypothetical protein
MVNIRNKFGQGISPQQFMDGMQIRNMQLSNIPNTKERFIQTYQNFTWENECDKNYFTALPFAKELRCIILCTDWCPDVIWNVPILLRVLEEAQIAVEILIMDDHLETMDLFSKDGSRPQPLALIVNEHCDTLGKWGARPNYIQQVMDDFKQKNSNKKAPDYQHKINKAYQEIGQLYNSSNQYQQVIIQELKDAFSTIRSTYFLDRGNE